MDPTVTVVLSSAVVATALTVIGNIILNRLSRKDQVKDRNTEVNTKLDSLDHKLSEHIEDHKKTSQVQDRLESKFNKLSDTLDTHINEYEVTRIDDARRRILESADSIRRGTQFSQEMFDSILDDIDEYEDYCTSHPGYENNKAIASIKLIKDTQYEYLSGKKKYL